MFHLRHFSFLMESIHIGIEPSPNAKTAFIDLKVKNGYIFVKTDLIKINKNGYFNMPKLCYNTTYIPHIG